MRVLNLVVDEGCSRTRTDDDGHGTVGNEERGWFGDDEKVDGKLTVEAFVWSRGSL